MSLQATASSIRTVPPRVPESGITLVARPASTRPQTTLTPARGSSRRDSTAGQLGDELGQGEGEVLGEVGAAGVAAAAGEPDRQAVGGAGDRALAQADVADVDGRVAVEAEDPADVVEARRGPSARSAPPGMTSSAGWNSSRTRPGSSPAACTSASAKPAPSSAVVWTSCPHAWATPATWLRHGSSVVSLSGRASRSARSATRGPASPRSAISPESPVRVRRQPTWSRWWLTRSVVRVSCHDSSGWACRSRRRSRRSSACLSTTVSTRASAACVDMSRRG